MRVLLRRGDLDKLLRNGSALANLPASAGALELECCDCRTSVLLVDYQGAGVLRIRCAWCRHEVALFAIAEGQANSNEELNSIPLRGPRTSGGRNN